MIYISVKWKTCKPEANMIILLYAPGTSLFTIMSYLRTQLCNQTCFHIGLLIQPSANLNLLCKLVNIIKFVKERVV